MEFDILSDCIKNFLISQGYCNGAFQRFVLVESCCNVISDFMKCSGGRVSILKTVLVSKFGDVFWDVRENYLL